MFSRSRNLSRILIVLSVIVFFVSALAAPQFGMKMRMDVDGNMTMSDCYMPGMMTLCNLSPLEHIAAWQTLFAGLPAQALSLMTLLVALASIVGLAWVRYVFSPPRELRNFSRFTRRREYVPLPPLFQELFSNGILNPKSY